MFKRKNNFAEDILSNQTSKIGFIDVGSGGPLKQPWSFIPEKYIKKHCIEPTSGNGQLPLCISNRIGKAKFYIAEDERGSSLHKPSERFAKRFGQNSILTKKTIDVSLTTLDQFFENKYKEIDAIDINTEGHDFQVLQGASDLLTQAFVKLIKIEFELVEVWKDQGWFSDIDGWMRAKGYDLANMELDYAKPVSVKSIFHQGEPLWGKAYYVPCRLNWEDHFKVDQNLREEVLKAVVLWTIADVPGRAVDIISWAAEKKLIDKKESELLQSKVRWALKLSILKDAKEDTIRFLKMPLRVVKYLTS